MSAERVYLLVPPAETTLAQMLGAVWDPEAQCWYVDAGQEERLWAFHRWMPYRQGDELNVISAAACIASLNVPCQFCGLKTEVICIHCDTGLVDGKPLRRFTCTRLAALDERLCALIQACYSQLRPSEVPAPNEPPACIHVNHCLHCGAPHEDGYLEAQWEHHFKPAGGCDPAYGENIELIAIAGTVQLRGRTQVIPD